MAHIAISPIWQYVSPLELSLPPPEPYVQRARRHFARTTGGTATADQHAPNATSRSRRPMTRPLFTIALAAAATTAALLPPTPRPRANGPPSVLPRPLRKPRLPLRRPLARRPRHRRGGPPRPPLHLLHGRDRGRGLENHGPRPTTGATSRTATSGRGPIGAIRVADSDPNIVYVSTGSDGIRSNVIIGDGVYKSTDAGVTWQHVGLERTGNSGAVLIHPEDPDLVYVAAIGNPFAPNPDRGVYRSRDGGANWEKRPLRLGQHRRCRPRVRARRSEHDLRQYVARRAEAVDDHFGRAGGRCVHLARRR